MARFKRGMRCYVKGGRYSGKFGTIKGSTYDEESGRYCREVVLDGEHFEELINVKHLRALTEAEWWMEALEADTKPWDERRMLNFIRMPVDVTKKPRYYGVPIHPFIVKGSGEQLSLFDERLAEIM